jgi:hypothetical protein
VPFTPGRVDATQEQTDVESFAVLEPRADGFRNYYGAGNYLSPADMLVDKADLLGPDRAGDDRARRRYARPGCQHRRRQARRVHGQPRHR